MELVESLKDKRIKIYNQENRGPAAARNIGLKSARGKYTAFLDADDYWKPCFLERTINFLEEHEDAVAVSVGQLHKMINQNEIIIPKILTEKHTQLKPHVLENFFDFWAKHKHVCTGSVLMRTEIAQKAGGQRNDLRICEDLEFWFYTATFGKWGFIPEILFTSDGTLVTLKKGLMAKHQIRRQMCPTVEQWQKRIAPCLGEKDWPGFNAARGLIGWTSAYSKIITGDDSSAQSIIEEYGKYFPKNTIIKITQFAASAGIIIWKFFCSLLRLREHLKNLYTPLIRLKKGSMISSFLNGK
jgi:glycosyltransferase involved in cell wall biosynthesis